MLELQHIKKDYPMGDNVVHALKGVSMQFRDSEFVAILGPSGCGKTTLLNIIGGLDRYTEGNLIINGTSTKYYKDRDWDAYRNHSVGFIFQNYNLIPHQTVLQNVELALTLSGVSKSERRRRAREALEQVGLGNQLRKKPSEMSGGQMQRVAIARALVNNPTIVLADEPTGALDSETGVQVMDILKEISRDRLVVMVTHNPDLAQQYASRIIRVLDGEITEDTAPPTANEWAELYNTLHASPAPRKNIKKQKKPSMSFFTSFGLSLKNLITKKGRTALTAFAGSIGIIGIALIYAVSNGLSTYIDMVQEDTLASYPLTIEASTISLASLMENFLGTVNEHPEHDNDAVYTKLMIYEMMDALNSAESTENDLESFKAYIEEHRADNDKDSSFQTALNGVQYSYDLDMLVYTENVDGTIIRSDTSELLQDMLVEFFGMDLSNFMSMGEQSGMPMSNMMTSSTQMWQEMLAGDGDDLINPLLEKQYDLVYGKWPKAYNEIVLVVDEHNELDDLTLYALGLKSKEEIDKIMDAAMNKKPIDASSQSWSYEEICEMDFRVILNADCYTKDAVTGTYTDLRDTEAGLRYLYDKGLSLKVTGIIRPAEEAVSAMMTGSIGYTSALTKHIIQNADQSEAIQAQLESPDTDIFTNLPFATSIDDMTDAQKETALKTYIDKLTPAQKADVYVQIMSIPSKETVDTSLSQMLGAMSREDMEQAMMRALSSQMSAETTDIEDYVTSMSDDDMKALFSKMMTEQIKQQYAEQIKQQLSGMTVTQLAGALDAALPTYTVTQCATYHDEVLAFSEADYESNLTKLGYLNLDRPSAIHLFASSFENKDVIEDAITEYNESVDELSQIKYTDYVGLMMSSITTIINAITYVLIAFVSISLIVSAIMIGVITLISVQERTKEIGILRAIGASKRNVAGLFNAETVIIGCISGLLGVGITYLLCFPINAIVFELTGLAGLAASLPIDFATFLVVVSILLTLCAGIIPSRSAAKKDPVVALRTE